MNATASPNDSVRLDASRYPRTYTASTGYQVFVFLLSGIVAAASLAGIWYFGTGYEAKKTSDPYVLSFICILFLLLSAYLVLTTVRYKVILTTEMIEVQELFKKKELLRSQLANWRILQTQYVSTLVLAPRESNAQKIRIALTIKMDDSFLDWLSAAPNLDDSELEVSRVQLEANRELGDTPQQRSERLSAGAMVAKRMNWIAAISMVWGLFFPRPYWLVILLLVALPVIAALIGFYSRGLYQFEGRRNDLRPSLALPVIGPGAVLAVRALSDLHFVRWQQLMPMALLIAFALVILITGSDQVIRQRRMSIVLFFLFCLMYAASVVAQADVVLDRSRPQEFSAEVLRKRVSTGRHTSYKLTISAWGPQTGITDVTVGPRDYSSVQAGQHVCVYLLPGALRIPWYMVRSCSE